MPVRTVYIFPSQSQTCEILTPITEGYPIMIRWTSNVNVQIQVILAKGTHWLVRSLLFPCYWGSRWKLHAAIQPLFAASRFVPTLRSAGWSTRHHNYQPSRMPCQCQCLRQTRVVFIRCVTDCLIWMDKLCWHRPPEWQHWQEMANTIAIDFFPQFPSLPLSLFFDSISDKQ